MAQSYPSKKGVLRGIKDRPSVSEGTQRSLQIVGLEEAQVQICTINQINYLCLRYPYHSTPSNCVGVKNTRHTAQSKYILLNS